MCFFPVAVQCERKPVEVTREKSVNCAASTEKIYIRKNLCSPLAAMPTFVSDKETARYKQNLTIKYTGLAFYICHCFVETVFILYVIQTADILMAGPHVCLSQACYSTFNTPSLSWKTPF